MEVTGDEPRKTLNIVQFKKERIENDWQRELATSFTSLKELVSAEIIDQATADSVGTVASDFQIRIPRYYAGLIDRTLGARDPIFQQAIPSALERDPVLPAAIQALSLDVFGRKNPWLDDAIGDLEKMAAPRLTHRYGNRAILHLSSLCALYCRFCFRKTHLNDDDRSLYEGSLDDAFTYLNSHSEISELILTGGDPLSVPDIALEKTLKRLASISHLRVVRIHTRMPVTMPSRLTENLAQMIRTVMDTSVLQIAIVAHFNHPNELTKFASDRIRLFHRYGITFYNQSVLLREVNDDAPILARLFQSLYELGVTPFYLHHTDMTRGTFHFRTSIERGREIMRSLQGLVSGPAMPRYVLDLPLGDGKIDLMDSENVVLLKKETADEISAAVYEVRSSAKTRTDSKPVRYLDLASI